jgi:hypothetical protein
MRFWTVQKKEVINEVYKNGFFQPDFNLSDSIEKNPELSNLYNLVLNSFNNINGTNLPGLIFTFVKANKDSEHFEYMENIDEFYKFIQKSRPSIQSLWNTLCKQDVVIVELEYSEKINPIYIDINDFQFLMPPIMLFPPYTQQSINNITDDIANGIIRRSDFPSYVIQAHLPCISKENIVNIYEMFPFE